MKAGVAKATGHHAFTLLELLVVVTLVAGIAGLVLGKLSGGAQAAALASAQASVANLIAAARTRAIASGQSVRVLVQIDLSTAESPLRFLRQLAIAVSTEGEWHPVTSISLPDGVCVVPGLSSSPAGLFPSSTTPAWTCGDGSPLRSTVFQTGNVCLATIESATAEQYAYFSIAAAGTTAQAGQLVLGITHVRTAGSDRSGESPVEFVSADAVRGLKVSQYGVVTLIADRVSF